MTGACGPAAWSLGELADGLTALGLDHSAPTLERFDRYLRELALWNPRLGLVSDPPSHWVTRHLLDCAAAVPHLRELLRSPVAAGRGTLVADLGSGAGLPGIPIALLMDDASVHLVERSGRRAGFLRNAVAAVGLSACEVHERDSEDYLRRFQADAPAGQPVAPPAAVLVVERAFRPFTGSTALSVVRALPAGAVYAVFVARLSAVAAEVQGLREGPAVEFAVDLRTIRIDVPLLGAERWLVTVARSDSST